MNRVRLALIPMAALALAGLTSACGGEKADVSRVLDATGLLETVHAAPEKTFEAKTARMSMTLEMKFAGEKFKSKVEGEIDFERQAFHQTAEILGFEIEQILVDGTIYQRDLGSDEWTELSIDDLPGGTNFDSQSGTADAFGQVDYLNVLEDVEEVGQEKVRDAQTTHYRGYFNLLEQLEKGGADVDDNVREIVESAEDPRVPMDVSIDEQGRAARTRLSYDLSNLGEEVKDLLGGEDISITIEIEMFDWGAPVVIEAPDVS